MPMREKRHVRLRNGWVLVLLSLTAAASLLAFVLARRSALTSQPAEHASALVQPRSSGYADPALCITCHEDVALPYSLTGMGRSFSRVDGSRFGTEARVFHHEASNRYYTMVQRGGAYYQRRHQIGWDGNETNVFELEAHYVIGSGNHARTFLHRRPDGRVVQLPVSWYAERGGYWAMSPGYDRAGHLDFRRVIDAGCMSCHNGYPRRVVKDDGAGPRFGDTLPEGIDCQRCHGPGQAHVDAVRRGDKKAIVQTIVNPAKLDRDRQLEACMQCHLETTSSPLPFRIQRYEQPLFSYTPGKPLSDYFIYFDRAPGAAGRDDRFEIAGGAYRLRQSACFQRSAMTCLTCHNPHETESGPSAIAREIAVCQGCHQGAHRGGTPQVAGVRAGATCVDCHMPKRRTQDAVHVVMTDHYIQRRPVRPDLLAARAESDSLGQGDYRGEVVPYYPQPLPPTPANALYLALAQVQQGSNLPSGIRQLEQAIEQQQPERPAFYYELGRAYGKTADHDADIRWCREALRHDAAFVPALKELAAAATAKGDMTEAAGALERAMVLSPDDGNAAADLGNVYLRQGRLDDAYKAVARALALDPTLPLANNTMGLVALQKAAPNDAETHFREAIRLQPDLAEAHNNLGTLLAGRHSYAEAAYHFEQAVDSNPGYIAARHSLGVTLALAGSRARAVAELQGVIELVPDLVAARLDLADVLAAMGRVAEARAQLKVVSNTGDPTERQAAAAALRALERRP